jgi:tetratricopeptide (TPR) repeat protein
MKNKLLFAMVALALACSQDRPQPQPVQPTVPATQAQPAAPAAEPPARARPPKPTKPTGAALETHRAQAKQFKTLLNDGRKAVKAGDHAAGIALYRQALALDPNSSAVLGELGWAAYLTKDYRQASRATQRALETAREPDRRGMLVYNLGRIAQSQGRTADAIALYRRSLSLRDNQVVAQRLAALQPATSAPAPFPTGRDEAAICNAIHEEWECARSDDEDQGCRCAVTKDMPSPSANPGWIRGAALFHIEGTPESGGMVDAGYLAIRGQDGGYHLVGMVTNGWIPGAFGINNEGRVDSLAVVAPPHGKGNIVILLATQHHSDTDMGTNAWTEISEQKLVTCVAHDEIRGCLLITVSSTDALSKIDEAGEQPPTEMYGKLGEKKWSLGHSFDDQGRVTFHVQSGARHLPPTHKALVGTHTAAELVGKKAVELVPFE